MQIIREILSPSLIVLLLMQGATSVWVKLDFLRRQDFIARQLCVNRNNPSKQCNGQCYLSFRLGKALQDQEKQAPNQRGALQEAWVYVAPEATFLFAFHEVNGLKFPRCTPRERAGFQPDIEHPPQTLA